MTLLALHPHAHPVAALKLTPSTCAQAHLIWLCSSYSPDLAVLKLTPSSCAPSPFLTGDGSVANASDVKLDRPVSYHTDTAGHGYICERSGRVRKIDASSNIISTFTTIPSTNVASCTIDKDNFLYAGDTLNNCIWQIDTAGAAITRWAGIGWRGNTGDGGNALSAAIFPYKAVSLC
jgi:hypothetical protein